MEFRFTLFNSITLGIMAATLAVAWARFRLPLASNWFLLYYAVIFGFTRGFEGSLNASWIAVGIAAAVFLRFELIGPIYLKGVRAIELVFFAYVLWRSLGLLLLW